MKILRRILLATVGALIGAMVAWAFVIYFLPSTPVERAMLIMLISCAVGFCVVMGFTLRARASDSATGR